MSRRITPVYLPERAELFVSTKFVKPKPIPFKDGKLTLPMAFGHKVPLLGTASRGLDLELDPSSMRVEKLYFLFPDRGVVVIPIADHAFAWPMTTHPGRKAEWGIGGAQKVIIPDLFKGRLTVLLKGEINLRTAEVEMRAFVIQAECYDAWREIEPLGYELYVRYDE